MGESPRRDGARAHRKGDGAPCEKGGSRAGWIAGRGPSEAFTGREQEAMNGRRCGVLIAIFAATIAVPTRAQQDAPAILSKVGITQNLNAQIPPDLVFRDETGRSVRIGDYFGQTPIVLSLVYFDCPALCTEVLNGELRTMKAISLDLGKDFEAVTVSFEPKDTPQLARAKRDVYA